MNKGKRTYLDMQLEEASLNSGRYNTDVVAQIVAFRDRHHDPR